MGQMNLMYTRIGHMTSYQGMTLKVVASNYLGQNGCNRCVFKSEEGAKHCIHSRSCFSYERPDKKSVKFIKVKK